VRVFLVVPADSRMLLLGSMATAISDSRSDSRYAFFR
jgi:hypothetical protein